MTVATQPNLLIRTFDWLKAPAIRDDELATMSHTDLQMLASDIGATENDL